jgi:hypothetical protein
VQKVKTPGMYAEPRLSAAKLLRAVSGQIAFRLLEKIANGRVGIALTRSCAAQSSILEVLAEPRRAR